MEKDVLTISRLLQATKEERREGERVEGTSLREDEVRKGEGEERKREHEERTRNGRKEVKRIRLQRIEEKRRGVEITRDKEKGKGKRRG